MKNQAYIHEDYPKACGFCERGSLSFDGTAILCCRKGIMIAAGGLYMIP